jgi:pyruvate/2-oxoglutarate/acetoin dehydrogenase E1 component
MAVESALRVTDFRTAVISALADEIAADPDVILMGEDVGFAGGVFQATRGLYDHFGANRVVDMPISELALAGSAFGAAITGLRPVIEIMFGDFMFLAMDSLVNQAAKYWFISNEQHSVPLVVRTAVGGGGRFGAIHSQMPGAWLFGIPGIKLLGPSNPSDAYWLLRRAVRDENPVVFLEHKKLYGLKGSLEPHPPVGDSRLVRQGGDVTLVGCMATVSTCLEAGRRLSNARIEADVIDVFSLQPLDVDAVVSSVQTTGRLVTVEE